MSTYSETAVSLFDGGFNCGQSVFAAFSEKYGMSRQLALKTAGGLGGGMRCGEVCGAVSGAVLTIGLKYGQNIEGDQESKSKCGAQTVEFIERFKSENGKILCRDILGCDISVKDGMEKAKRDNLFKTTCVGMIKSAVRILEDMGY